MSEVLARESRYVNKTHEVYLYIVDNPGKNEKEILHALPHLSAPVVHASLKMLSEGGYVSRKETSELNKLGRKICEFRANTGRKYEPTYHRHHRKASKPGNFKNRGPVLNNPEFEIRFEAEPCKFEEGCLKLPTKNGSLVLPLSEAHSVYYALKKLFEGKTT